MSSSHMYSSNNCIDTIGKYPISLVFCVAIFKVSRVKLMYKPLQTTDKENLVKHEFLRPQDMPLTENSNEVFLPVVGEDDLFL